MKQEGYGASYEYDPDCEDGFSGQDYFPDGFTAQTYYHPVSRGYEREIQKRLDYWDTLRKKRQVTEFNRRQREKYEIVGCHTAISRYYHVS